MVGVNVGFAVDGSILHGAGLSLQLSPLFFTLPRQQPLAPPGLAEHPEPPHIPHDAKQH